MRTGVYGRGGDRFAVVASKASAPTDPDRYHNLCAHPGVTVEIGTTRCEALAEVDRPRPETRPPLSAMRDHAAVRRLRPGHRTGDPGSDVDARHEVTGLTPPRRGAGCAWCPRGRRRRRRGGCSRFR
ncbi:nitroreductase/quinone reductase family protein [Nocardia brevicatena]|uniref:nitroreductase/quinone reductase family protein n=1 Tax=Nocardia brevicatena TaxID=37327 RepID=UPI003F688E4D